MNKNIKILLAFIVCIMIFTLAGCKKEEKLDVLIDQKSNEENSDISTSTTSNDILEDERLDEEKINVTTKVLNEEEINLLKGASLPNYEQSSQIEFFTLRPSEEKVIKLNGKEIALEMGITSYSISRGEGGYSNYLSYDYYVEMSDYLTIDGNTPDKHSYKFIGQFEGEAKKNCFLDHGIDISKLNGEQVMKNIGIKIGVLKDLINAKEYLVCYVEEKDFEEDTFYIYDDECDLVYQGDYCHYYLFENIIPADNGERYRVVEAMRFYENQIICYDMYMKFENGDKINIEKDIVNKVIEDTNKVHKITIENGVVKDRIIKIYEGVIYGSAT